jgi:hypothetical protein
MSDSAKFTLRFQNSRTHELLGLVADQMGVRRIISPSRCWTETSRSSPRLRSTSATHCAAAWWRPASSGTMQGDHTMTAVVFNQMLRGRLRT